MKEKAYAKINLSINVINKREDGYHNMDMIMLPIGLYDEIEMEVSNRDDYLCNIDLPYNEKNIIYKCIELLRSEYGFKEHFRIKVQKNIPMQAGLAGGSTDGAAAMRMVNELCRLHLNKEKLAELGKRVGADIPFCIYSTPSRVQGIGEIVKPFELKEDYKVLIIKPQSSINTGQAFKMLDLAKAEHPDMDQLQRAFIGHQPIAHLLGNTLLQSGRILAKEVDDIINECKALGYENTTMSGSGSAVFTICDADRDFADLKKAMQKKYPFVCETTIIR